MSKTRWPDEWPILSGRDFCRNKFIGDRGRRCLAGWYAHVRGVDPREDVPGIRRFADLVASTARHLSATGTDGNGHVTDINDDIRNPKSLLARIWNRVGARLGYTRGNPECDRNGKLRPA